jgi:predicted Zn-dependent peptidase
MSWDPYSEFQTTVLDNGLTIHALQIDRPWQRIGFMVHAGALHDSLEKEGSAHFVEHLVSNNASVSSRQIDRHFNGCGGSAMLGMTSFWWTKYSFFVPAKEPLLKKSLSYFGSMLIEAKLEKKIERERQVILNEFKRKYPFQFKYDIQLRGHTVINENNCTKRMLSSLGTEGTINSITQKDLQEYYNTRYVPANISVVAVGKYSLYELRRLLSESPFGRNKTGGRTAMPYPKKIAPLTENRFEMIVSKYVGSTILTNAAYESHGKIPMSYSRYAVMLLLAVLRELLHSEIREKHAWTYSTTIVWYDYYEFYKILIESPSFSISAVDRIEETVNAIIDSVPNKERIFNKIKKNRLKGVFMNDETAADMLSESMSDVHRYGKVISLSEFYEGFEKVTFEEICNIIPYLAPKKRWTMIAIP